MDRIIPKSHMDNLQFFFGTLEPSLLPCDHHYDLSYTIQIPNYYPSLRPQDLTSCINTHIKHDKKFDRKTHNPKKKEKESLTKRYFRYVHFCGSRSTQTVDMHASRKVTYDGLWLVSSTLVGRASAPPSPLSLRTQRKGKKEKGKICPLFKHKKQKTSTFNRWQINESRGYKPHMLIFNSHIIEIEKKW